MDKIGKITVRIRTQFGVNQLINVRYIKKMKFFIKDFFSKCDQIREFPADFLTFTVETFTGNLHFLRSVQQKSEI